MDHSRGVCTEKNKADRMEPKGIIKMGKCIYTNSKESKSEFWLTMIQVKFVDFFSICPMPTQPQSKPLERCTFTRPISTIQFSAFPVPRKLVPCFHYFQLCSILEPRPLLQILMVHFTELEHVFSTTYWVPIFFFWQIIIFI